MRWLSSFGYKGITNARLWLLLRGPLACGLLALTVGGCSLSYQLDSFWTKSDRDVAQTSSIRTGGAAMSATVPSENDLVVARAAVSAALDKGGKDTSTPWENPRTGARGTITPIAAAYNQDGNTCQDFLASYVRDGGEAWLQGEACRARKGRWEVRRLRPWPRG